MSVEGITASMQYLTCKLDEEIFALEILKVREVLEFKKVTKVPQTPTFMKGVINLRGSVVPVLDMGLKLGMPEVAKTIDTCVVIIELVLAGEPTLLGILVDAVREVIDLEPNQIDPPPRIGSKLRTDFIKGMGKRDEEFMILVDLDKVFSAQELAMVQEAGKTVETDP